MQLVLEAEMKLPGKAWLTWRIERDEASGKTLLHQVAYFAPKGLLGRVYWYAMLPFHRLIFRRMAYAIADEGMLIERTARREGGMEPAPTNFRAK